ncbi:hypothetical protein K402DRAFT_374621 [Aulographum hederae CBS 113979]|uniref:EthD domain-containing protein n=1 Tax=Aulographum hederae CBS 113979 TaxID=1176131 RepID=A0A6G1H4N1_9PEZI|nr:hypothetical protein K402DRAFT_374621 [Aulographum hederae CBS 113979]
MPSPFLLFVNSKPTAVSDEVWKKWYTTEHIPDIVSSRTSTRACLFEEDYTSPISPKEKHERRYLALYQTDFEEALQSSNYQKCATTSEMLAKNGGSKEVFGNGEFDSRYYGLVQTYDPNKLGEAVPPPYILTVEMSPFDEEDFNSWYKEEHLDLLAKVPGYRRTLRFKHTVPNEKMNLTTPPSYLAIHELDSTEHLGGKEIKASMATDWSKKIMEDSTVFVGRVWKLIGSQGAVRRMSLSEGKFLD